MFTDVAERNLSAVVEAAGDNAPIVEYCNMSVKCTASAGDDFAGRFFDAASFDALLWMTFVAIFGLRRRPFKSCVFVQIEAAGDVETLVATAKMPGRDFDAESLVDAL